MIPLVHRAGVTIDWSFEAAPYTPNDGWSATVYLTPLGTASAPCDHGAIDIDATVNGDGDGWEVKKDPSFSERWAAGTYALDIEVTKGTETYVAHSAEFRVTAALGTKSAELTKWGKQLKLVDEAIECILKGKGVQENRIQTTMGERELTFMSLKELRLHRTWVLGKINTLERALGFRKYNKQSWRPIRTYVK